MPGKEKTKKTKKQKTKDKKTKNKTKNNNKQTRKSDRPTNEFLILVWNPSRDIDEVAVLSCSVIFIRDRFRNEAGSGRGG